MAKSKKSDDGAADSTESPVTADEVMTGEGTPGPDVTGAIAMARAALAHPIMEGHPGTAPVAEMLREIIRRLEG
jgi:hypothetical protein